MDENLQEYLTVHRKKQLFKILSEVWTQIQLPSKLYLVLNKNAEWGIKIHAIYKTGIAIYHEERDG